MKIRNIQIKLKTKRLNFRFFFRPFFPVFIQKDNFSKRSLFPLVPIKLAESVYCFFGILIILLMFSPTNIASCGGPYLTSMAGVVEAIQDGELTRAQEILDALSIRNRHGLTAHNYQEINDLITTRLRELNPDTNYVVEHMRVREIGGNSGNVPIDHPSDLTWRDLVMVLFLVAVMVTAVFFIYKYWADIRDAIFTSGRRGNNAVITTWQTIVTRRFTRLQDDPVLISRLIQYFADLEASRTGSGNAEL